MSAQYTLPYYAVLPFELEQTQYCQVDGATLSARVFSLISLAPFGATDWVNGTRLRLSLSFAFRNKHEQQLILHKEAKAKFVPLLMWCGIHCCTLSLLMKVKPCIRQCR